MAIKFEDYKGGSKPAKKDVGGKTYVAEEPAMTDKPAKLDALPFAKPTRPDKKGQKVRQK